MRLDSTVLWLSLAIAISAIAGIWAHYANERWRWMVYLCRPLAGVLILALALSAPDGIDGRYRWGIVVGLALALVADGFLMQPRDCFLAGLLFFAGTHVSLLIAFTSGAGCAQPPLAFFLVVPFGAAVVAYIWRGVGRSLKLPVIFYVALLVAMTSQAWTRHLTLGSTATLVTAAGASLFLLSDAVLSVEKFREQFSAARLVILSTFFAADWLIALSLRW